MNAWLAVIVAALSVVGTGATTLIVQRSISRRASVDAKSDTAQRLIDQLQEERNDAADRHTSELAALRSEVADLRHRMDDMEDRELAFSDYVAALRDHIDQRLGPPPPPWPVALLRRRTDRPADR